ncbi:MAG: sensor histidine kinase, partial [bacterium]|nr:sensor histidine kinase [bacterium]
RYSLVNGEKKEVPLKQEIDAINNFLEIQKIRFEENIEVDIRVARAAERVPIPCFLIHPLVENALKYGMKTSPKPLKIRLYVDIDKDRLEIKVQNTGKLMKQAPECLPGSQGTGTGLKNIKQRLELLCFGSSSFEIIEDNGWVSAIITLKMAT